MMNKSKVEAARGAYEPKMPVALSTHWQILRGANTSAGDAAGDEIKALFPYTYGMPVVSFEAGDEISGSHYTKPVNVGVILSGGQAPGGHNVIAGLFDGIKHLQPESRLYGFLMGPDGLINHQYMELTAEVIEPFRNTGGFDMIGSGRTKLDKKEQFDTALEVLTELEISALVIIGGDDSNTNAAVLAEYYRSIDAPVQVIGCPKTIDGDLKNEYIECSFGFDTATKVYSELIGNIQRDCASARKYWHFIKLMGRTASHITLECALRCRPNLAIISEEVEAANKRLDDIIEDICRVIARRAAAGLMFGTVLIPEGLIEFLPSMKALIHNLNEALATHGHKLAIVRESAMREYIASKLSAENAAVFLSLPEDVALQMCACRDPHGNVQVSLIETEKLLVHLVEKHLEVMRAEGRYTGRFSALTHFFGYEGRCSIPSNFDADYCYSLGRTAVALIAEGLTGYIATVNRTALPAIATRAGGVPATMMMHVERRSGKSVPVIKKALVDLDGAPFLFFRRHRAEWSLKSCYCYPGPIQLFGPSEICDDPTVTLFLEQATRN